MRYQAAISIGSAESTHIVAADDEQDAILRLGILIGMRLPHVNVDSVSLHAIQSEAEAFSWVETPDDRIQNTRSMEIARGKVNATPDQVLAALQEAIANGAFD